MRSRRKTTTAGTTTLMTKAMVTMTRLEDQGDQEDLDAVQEEVHPRNPHRRRNTEKMTRTRTGCLKSKNQRRLS